MGFLCGAGGFSSGQTVTALQMRWCNVELRKGEGGSVWSLTRDCTRQGDWKGPLEMVGGRNRGRGAWWEEEEGGRRGDAHTLLESCDGLAVVKRVSRGVVVCIR